MLRCLVRWPEATRQTTKELPRCNETLYFECLLKAVPLPAPQYTLLNQRVSTLYAKHAITKDGLGKSGKMYFNLCCPYK